MRNILIVAALFLNTPVLLSAQALASFGNVKQAEMDLSNTVRLLEQNILLALSVGVLLLGILWVAYMFKEYTQSKRINQTKRNNFLSLLLLIAGMSAFCSSCGLPQQMQVLPLNTAQEYVQQGCPHHHSSYQEPFAFTNVYRTIGYPTLRTTICKFCGQRMINPQD